MGSGEEEAQYQFNTKISTDIPNDALIRGLTETLEKTYLEKKVYWRQQSHIQWFQGGNRNTGYFHAVTKGRRAQNQLTMIEDDDRNVRFDEDQIASTVSNNYVNLFKSNENNDFHIVNEVLQPRITSSVNEALISIPKDEEIRGAVFSIRPDKAPGPEGFSAAFYQSFWDIIGQDVSSEIRSFLRQDLSTGDITRLMSVSFRRS